MKKVIALFLLLMVTLSAWAEDDEPESVAKLDSAKVQQLRKQMTETKGFFESNRDHWVRRVQAARQLGDLVETAKLADQALLELKGDQKTTSFLIKQKRTVIQTLYGPNKEFFEIYEQIIRDEPDSYAELYSLAKHYIGVKNFARATELTQQANEAVKKIKPSPWVSQNSLSKQLQIATVLALAEGRYEDVVRHAREHIPVADWVAVNAQKYNSLYAESYRALGTETRRELAIALIKLEQFDEARKTLLESGRIVRELTMGVHQQAHVWRNLARVDLAQGRFMSAQTLLQKAEAILRDARYQEKSPLLRDVLSDKLKVQVALQKFDEEKTRTVQAASTIAAKTVVIDKPVVVASEVAVVNPAPVDAKPVIIANAETPPQPMEQTEKPTASESKIEASDVPTPVQTPSTPLVKFKPLNGTPIDNAITLWRRGDSAAALMQIGTELKRMTERYGSEHYFTVRSDALRIAIEQTQKFDLKRQKELAALCEKLLSAQEAQSKEPIEIAYRRQIFEAYLKDLAQSGTRDAGLIDIGFRLADAMRDSMVGRVLADAARRAVAGQSGLSELVNRQRNLKNELAASYDNLASVLGRKQEDQDKQVLVTLRQTLQSQQDEQLRVERDIARRFPEYSQLLQGETPQIRDIARLLTRGEAYISVFPGHSASYIWVITRDQAPLFYTARLSEDGIRELVLRLRKTLEVGDIPVAQMPAFDIASARLLYEVLLAPAQGILKTRSQLVINVGGALAQIPFGILAEPGNPQNTGIAWLARRYTVTHISSSSAFANTRQSSFREAAGKPFIGFADPLFSLQNNRTRNGSTRALVLNRANPESTPETISPALKDYAELPALPETRDEALAMANALGADSQDIYLGPAATREAVLKAPLNHYQIVAFATHGLMAGDLPDLNQPALALSVSEHSGKATFLTLEDVMGLKLNADWVVLSACNTAAADGEASESLSGLGRGFFYAGARALLVTHWAVETESAKQLVVEIFKNYSGDKSLSRAEALRRAQLKLIDSKQYAHPFYWAPYALVGDGG